MIPKEQRIGVARTARAPELPPTSGSADVSMNAFGPLRWPSPPLRRTGLRNPSTAHGAAQQEHEATQASRNPPARFSSCFGQPLWRGLTGPFTTASEHPVIALEAIWWRQKKAKRSLSAHPA